MLRNAGRRTLPPPGRARPPRRLAPLAPLALVLLAACVCPPDPAVIADAHFRTPEAALESYQAYVAADLVDWEYRCYSADLRRREGLSLGTYAEARAQLLAGRPWLKLIAKAEVLRQWSLDERAHVIEVRVGGRTVHVRLVREDSYEIRSGEALLADGYAPFETLVRSIEAPEGSVVEARIRTRGAQPRRLRGDLGGDRERLEDRRPLRARRARSARALEARPAPTRAPSPCPSPDAQPSSPPESSPPPLRRAEPASSSTPSATAARKGTAACASLLGGKGANLAEMCRLGLPVPPGFTITTEVCTYYYAHDSSYPRRARGRGRARRSRKIEQAMGKRFGDPKNPLLVSVRSGARVSMPGMMDTVLNIGLNDATVRGPRAKTRQRALRLGHLPPLRADVRRRRARPEAAAEDRASTRSSTALDELKQKRGVARGHRADADGPRGAGRATSRRRQGAHRQGLPRGPARAAVGRDRRRLRLVEQRPRHRLPRDVRHPRRLGHGGQHLLDGLRQHGRRLRHRRRLHARPGHRREALLRRVPDQRPGRGRRRRHPHAARRSPSWRRRCRAAWRELLRIQKLLEKHYRDVQDIEFTIQKGKLWMLQSRNGKRTGFAAVRIAVDMVDESADHARKRRCCASTPRRSNQLLQPIFDPASSQAARSRRPAAGARASTPAPARPPGASSSRAERAPRRGGAAARRVILVRRETSPEDIRGMQAADGILTACGGMTSHAALVAGRWARSASSAAGELEIDYDARTRHGRRQARCKEGDWISHRRLHRRGDRRAGRDEAVRGRAGAVRARRCERGADERRSTTQFARADGLGRRGAQARACAPTPTSPTRPSRRRVRRRGHRPVPHRAHVLRRRQVEPCAR